MVEKVKVGICIPSTGTVRVETAKSLAMLCTHFNQTPVWKDTRQSFVLLTTQGSMLVQLRHTLVATALKEKCTHLLFLDSDMVFPKDTLNRLLGHKKAIVAANCTTRSLPPEPVAHDLLGRRLMSKGKRGLQKVQQAGLAVCLVEAKVFMEMRPPFFMMEWVEEYGAYCGEDVYFSQLVQHHLRKDIWVDHTLSQEIKHIGHLAYTHDMVESETLKETG